jgi:formylglycine-generating enzyme required for sulfatase activity
MPGLSREQNEGESRQPEPYGLFPADESVYGTREMVGGVRNWTKTETGGGILRIVKGGNWGPPAAWCRAANRDVYVPEIVYAANGVRLAARRAPPDRDF